MTTTQSTDADLNQRGIVDAATAAWPLLTPVIITHEGGEICHPSTDALIGYDRDYTTYGYVVGHKIRNVEWSDRAQRFIVIRECDGTEQYYEVDVHESGEITGYMTHFERDGVTEAYPSDALAAWESNEENFGDLVNDLVADGSLWPL